MKRSKKSFIQRSETSEINTRHEVDMSPAAVTARIKQACRLGDAELLASPMRDAVSEITTGKTNPGMYPKWKFSL